MEREDCFIRIYDLVTSQRHETRAAAVMDLVEILLNEGYEDQLTNVFLDDAPEVEGVEGLIFGLIRQLGHIYGIAFTEDGINEQPRVAVRVLLTVIERLETYEDINELYGVVMSEETDIIILEQLTRLMFGDQNIHFEGVVELVEPRTMTTIRNFITANQIEEFEEGIRPMVVAYLRRYPENPSPYVFINAPAKPNILLLSKMLDWSPENGIDELKLTAIYAVGLTILLSEGYNDAIERVENVVQSILPPDVTDLFEIGKIVKEASQGLLDIYGHTPEEDDEA